MDDASAQNQAAADLGRKSGQKRAETICSRGGGADRSEPGGEREQEQLSNGPRNAGVSRLSMKETENVAGGDDDGAARALANPCPILRPPVTRVMAVATRFRAQNSAPATSIRTIVFDERVHH